MVWWWILAGIWWLIGVSGILACHYFLDEDDVLTLGWLILSFILGFSGVIPWIILGAYKIPKRHIVVWKWKK